MLGFESANKGFPLGSVKDHLGSIGGVEASGKGGNLVGQGGKINYSEGGVCGDVDLLYYHAYLYPRQVTPACLKTINRNKYCQVIIIFKKNKLTFVCCLESMLQCDMAGESWQVGVEGQK